MTEKQAWLTIAKAFATPRGERTEKQESLMGYTNCRGELIYAGVCRAILIIEPISSNMYTRMMEKVGDCTTLRIADINFCGDWFCSPYPPRNDKLRADFCYLMYYILGGE